MILDPIQNQALRLATGAFRSSPISSIQCIAATPALNSHPTNTNLPPNSIPKRISNLITSYNIPHPNYEYPLFSTFPPWLSPQPIVNLSMRQYNKTEYSNALLNKLMQETISKNFPNHTQIFTDGSKSDKGVGAAFVTHNTIKMFKLPKYVTIFSAELLALKEAIKYSLTIPYKKPILIISDSLSALSAISSRNLDHNYIRHIYDLIYTASLKRRSIALLWAPSHIGNKGNDRADYFAKRAIEQGIPIMAENHYSDFNKYLRSFHKTLFQLSWDLQDPNNKLWPIKPEVYPPLDSTNMGRRDNVYRRRLAIGHTLATHSHLMNKEPPPICSSCNAPLTVLHIFETTHFKSTRTNTTYFLI